MNATPQHLPVTRWILSIALLLVTGIGARADVLDDYGAVLSQLQEATLNAAASQSNPEQWAALVKASERLSSDIQSPAAEKLWNQSLQELEKAASGDPVAQAVACGVVRARLEYVSSLETLACQKRGDIPGAQAWRALISLPRHANAVEGALALRSQLSNASQIQPVSNLLAKECLEWQSQRIREKLDHLQRLVASGQYNETLLKTRFAEITTLAAFDPELEKTAGLDVAARKNDTPSIDGLIALALPRATENFETQFKVWRGAVEGNLPSFLTPQEVARYERLLLKLVKLVPKEYNNGVRDGKVVVPLEYREAVTFIVQAQQLSEELKPVWAKTRATALQQHHEELASSLSDTEKLITQKSDPSTVEEAAKKTQQLLEDQFGLTLQRSGDAGTALEETVLDIRTSLKNSLAAAQSGNWELAESYRLDAYTTFDNDIEKRVLPRDYALGIKAERGFLDGQHGKGIGAALSARLRGAELEAVYQQTLDNVDQCQSLLKVGLSPATVMFTTVSIVAREGLEAVVILAALMAGLRGEENRSTRQWIARGAWLALFASAVTFWLSRTLIASLSRYGEKLEAIVSILAVGVLLVVTNWVFHKYYWAEWNSKLRHLTKASKMETTARWQWLALISVGFVTIYREGFETSLFMQSLLMEGSHKAVASGVLLAAVLIATLGGAIFIVGTKLPIRKMLVVTGLFVVSILIMFLGSTVRLFQTVGWLPIHPINGFEIPTWMGQWLGLYPSWEGILIPFLGIAYVGGAWLYMKITASREQLAPVLSSTPASRKVPLAKV